MEREKKIGRRGLTLTMVIVALAILTYSIPGASALLIYERQAIHAGELWRLFTAPLVHFSTSHLVWNLLVFAPAGIAVSAAGFRRLWLVCIYAALVPGVVFFLAMPQLERYGGLSGLATATAVYFCLGMACRAENNKYLWLLILLFISIKITLEALTGTPIFAQTDTVPFRVLPSVHMLAFSGAVVIYFCPGSKQAIAQR